MKFGSLFSGIGGLDLGLERAGMECRWQVEYSEYPQAILRQHWPDIPVYTDIHDVYFTKVEPVDLICGGFPCQPFSTGGKRRGMRDPRWLWNEFARAIDTIKPSYVLGENVPGLLTADKGAAFGFILADLAALGYDAQWEVVPAAAVSPLPNIGIDIRKQRE